VQSGKPLVIIAETSKARLGHAGRQPSPRRPEGRGRQAPGFGDRRKAMLQDIAVLTGGQASSSLCGLTNSCLSIITFLARRSDGSKVPRSSS